MKVEVLKTVEIEVYAVRIEANIRIDDDLDNEWAGLVNVDETGDGKTGNLKIEITVDDGKVLGWTGQQAIVIEDKVCDSGTYTLLDKNLIGIVQLEHEYVPNRLIPGEYGDYIDLKINAEGYVENWPKQPDVSEFFENED